MRGVDLSDQRMTNYYVGEKVQEMVDRVLSYILEACS